MLRRNQKAGHERGPSALDPGQGQNRRLRDHRHAFPGGREGDVQLEDQLRERSGAMAEEIGDKHEGHAAQAGEDKQRAGAAPRAAQMGGEVGEREPGAADRAGHAALLDQRVQRLARANRQQRKTRQNQQNMEGSQGRKNHVHRRAHEARAKAARGHAQHDRRGEKQALRRQAQDHRLDHHRGARQRHHRAAHEELLLALRVRVAQAVEVPPR